MSDERRTSSTVFDTPTQQFGRLLHYAGLAVVLICAALAYSWLYSPLERKILDTTMKIDELTLSRSNADAIRKEHERLSGRLQEIEARYAALRRRVPPHADAGNFLKQVSEIASQEKLVISNFQPADSVERESYSMMEVLLEGRGSFASICSFFDRLAKIQRLSKVRHLSITVDEMEDTYPIQSTIVIYYGLKARGVAAAGEADRG